MTTNYLNIIADLKDNVTPGLARMIGGIRAATRETDRLSAANNRMNVLMNKDAFMRDTRRRNIEREAVALRVMNAQLEKQNRLIQRNGRQTAGHHRNYWTPMQQSLAALGGYGYALGRGGAFTLGTVGSGVMAYQAMKQYAQLEDQLANIQKVISTPDLPVSKTDMGKYANVSRALSSKYGITAADAAQSMFRLAQTGVTGFDNLSTMADIVAKINLAWDDVDPEKISNTLGRMGLTFFSDDLQNNPAAFRKKMQNAADAINVLEANFPTTGTEIVDAMMRGQPQAKAFGLDAEQTAAIFAAQLSAGEPSGERVGTRSRIMFQRLTSFGGTDREKRIKTIQKLLGWSPKQWEENRKKDAIGTFLKLSAALAKLPDAERLAALGNFMGEEAGATANTAFGNFGNLLAHLVTADDETAKLVANTKEYMDVLEKSHPALAAFVKAQQKSKAAGSIDAEIAVKLNTLSASANRAWESVKNLLSSFGESNAGPLKSLLDSITEKLSELSIAAGEEREKNRPERRDAPSGGRRFNSVLTPYSPNDAAPYAPSYNPYGPSGEAMDERNRRGGIHGDQRPEYYDDGWSGRDKQGNFRWTWGASKGGWYKYYPPHENSPDEKIQQQERRDAVSGALGAIMEFFRSHAPGSGQPGVASRIPGGGAAPTAGGYGTEGQAVPVPWPQITVVPPPPMTIPLLANVTQPGMVTVTITNPSVGFTSQGASIPSGAQADPGPAGTATR